MSVLMIVGKVLLFPFVVVLSIIQWVGIFLISVSSVVFNLLAGLLLLVAVLSLIFGVSAWTEALRPVLAGFIIFMIPVIGQGITAIIAVFREGLSDFIWS